ncbi:MAG: hypothetical protein PGN27_05520 [Mycolicibacterium neoaurum]|uniref:hypothetical protein n=1 Tax=Mycolicibacterium neoaurum TaxID=1795 RepID=UPI002FF8BBDB
MAKELTIETLQLRGGLSVQVSALRTDVRELVITPAMHVGNDNAVTFGDGYLQLTHAPTGRTVSNGSCRRLDELATKLAPFRWDFKDPNHFRGDANQIELDKIKAVIREWEMAEDSGMPIGFSGDSDEMLAARQAAPAATLLREHIDSFFDTEKRRRDIKWEDSKELYVASIAYACEAYGFIYVLGVLRAIDPTVADAAARDLVGAWECGEFGEWVYQWSQELAAGRPLTLHGIPTSNPLGDFS